MHTALAPAHQIDEDHARRAVQLPAERLDDQYAVLDEVLHAERPDLAVPLALAILRHVLARGTDLYGYPLDPYERHLAPLLGVVLGAGLGPTPTRAHLAEALGGLSVAAAQFRLVMAGFRRELHPGELEVLETGMAALRTRVGLAVPALQERAAGATFRTGIHTRSYLHLGWIRGADAIAGATSDGVDPYGLSALGRGYRELGRPERALDFADRVLTRDHAWTASLNVRAAALCDLGEVPDALETALRSWELCRTLYSARTLRRAARLAGDRALVATAQAFIEQHEGAFWEAAA